MNLARLPNPAKTLVFRFVSHPCADMIKDAFELAGPLQCQCCHTPFRRCDRGLWMEGLLVCADCLTRQYADQPYVKDIVLGEVECVYPDGWPPGLYRRGALPHARLELRDARW